MEQKELSRKSISIITIIGVISAISLVLSIVALQKVSQIGSSGGFRAQSTGPAVDLGPTAFAGFAGKPTSASVSPFGKEKTFELRGHVMSDPKSTLEDVPSTDTLIKKITIDSNTKFYRIGKRKGDGAPVTTSGTFEQFTIPSTAEIYIAYYEAKEGVAITDTTPASSVAVFSE